MKDSIISPDREIRYLRFLNNTLQVKKLRGEICDDFTRKIFDYLDDEPRFDTQVFCAFIYKFIYKCKLYKSLIMTAEHNIYDKIKLDAGSIVNELYLFLDLHTVSFTLSSVDPNQFHNISIKEKLKHLIVNDEPSVVAEYEGKSTIAKLSRKNNPSWMAARVNIIVPEFRGNTGIVPYFDLEFKLPRLSVEQKLDIIHFAICALNYLAETSEPEIVASARPNPLGDTPLPELVSKPEHLKVISDNLFKLRDAVILNAIRDKESGNEELDKAEFDLNQPTTARILQAQSRDVRIEKRWLNLNQQKVDEQNSKKTFLDRSLLSIPLHRYSNPNPLYVGGEAWYEIGSVPQDSQTGEDKKTSGYPPHLLEQIINTAVRLYKTKDKVRGIDIYTEIGIEKNTYNKRIKHFGYDTAKILDEARARIREQENSKSSEPY